MNPKKHERKENREDIGIELNEAQLDALAGGTADGPDGCSKCGSMNVGYSYSQRAAICFDCGARI